MELLELIRMLNAAHGPSGDERGIAEVIAHLAKPWADQVRVDTLGNVVVHKAGPGPRVALAAHMDSIGLIVTHVEDNGSLRVGKLGGLSPKEAWYTTFRFSNGTRGVFVPEEKGEGEKRTLDQCYLDIGAGSREEALELVQVGDTAVYDAPCWTREDMVVSPYLDNRISCGVLLQVLERLEQCPNDLYLVFTVQEEVGLRGGRTAAWSLEPDWAVAVDVTDVDDTPGTQRWGTAKLGKGAAVKLMDSSALCHPAVVERLEHLAGEKRIPVQRDVMRQGGTDAGAFQTARMGALTGGVSIPCRYIHTPVEMASLSDAEHCVELLLAFVGKPLPTAEQVIDGTDK